MNESERYRDEIAHIFAEASEEIAALPAELAELGQDLLARSNPLRNGGQANRISYLLPYWMGEHIGSPIELCRDLAVGNIFAMLHFFLLDDAMDGGTSRSKAGLRRSLALGQLLYGLFQKRYSRRFSNGSPLWDYYRKYVEEWASAVHSEASVPMNPCDAGQLARKAAPVKVCAAGLLLDAGQPVRIPDTEQAIDLALAVLQLSDDWADWREDLPESNRNAFLSLVREKLSLHTEDLLDERSVKRATYHYQCVDRLAEIAEDYVERAMNIPNAPKRLISFQNTIARSLRIEAFEVEESTRKLALGGGIDYLLSEFRK